MHYIQEPVDEPVLPGRGDRSRREPAKSGDVSIASVRHVVVDEGAEGQRLDNFLAALCAEVPKSRLYRWIRSGELRVNGGRRGIDYRLQLGDDVRVPPVRVASPSTVPAANPVAVERVRRSRAALATHLPICYEDDDLLVVDKPAAVAVHGGSGLDSGVIERLRAARPQARFLELVHRIDRETSGLLVVARRRPALVAMQEQWRRRAPAKRYLAVVHGRVPLRTRLFDGPLQRLAAPDGDRRVRVHPDGQEARTRVRGLLHFELPVLGEFSLVEAVIETGRTHQIRVHLSHAGLPIAGDPKYGNFALNKALAARGFGRMFLHAAGLRLRHPTDHRVLDLRSPLPPAFAALAASGGVTVDALTNATAERRVTRHPEPGENA